MCAFFFAFFHFTSDVYLQSHGLFLWFSAFCQAVLAEISVIFIMHVDLYLDYRLAVFSDMWQIGGQILY